jgi:hypothetical protein
MSVSGLNDRFKYHPDLSIEEIISIEIGDNRFPCNYDGVYYKNRNHFCKEYASKIGISAGGLDHRFKAHPDLSIDFIVGKYPIIKSLISNTFSSQSIPDINIIEEVLPDLFKCEETINGQVIGTLKTKNQIFNLWKERKCGYWEFNE